MSSSTPVTEAAFVPFGWTDKEGYLGKSYYWAEKNSVKTMLQEEYKIPNVNPLITRLRDFGDVIFLFESTDVCRIDGQTDLNGIYKVMSGNRGCLGKLALTEVFPVGSQ